MIGKTIAGRYKIEAELGAGGMGTVYRGLDTQSEQMVAIKQLKPELTTPELIERFVREGAALRELNHPNIVKMLDEVEENGNHYLIMEYLAAGDLNNLLKAGQLTVEKVLQIAIDICDALTRAHRLDIIHRDLKPANVLLAEDGTPRLTDFGVAHMGRQKRVTDTDAIIGTLDYLAPESFEATDIDSRADIWAFGVMLFEMLTGERPFKGDRTLMAIMTEPVPDLEVLRPDASVALVDLVYRMLEKDRNARIRSIRQVGLDLEDMLHGRTTHTPPETRFAPETPDFLHRPKHNLPAQTTPFVGRESELTELPKLLDDPKIRLMTVLAPGGMGKTRLALEAAERQIPNFENGVYFVELAPLSDSANIMTAIAEATGYQFQGDEREPKQQILDFLRNKNMLLVLDNYEHLLDGASLVTDILQAALNVQILATSRQRLGQPSETLFHLSGMDFPAWETPEDAMNYAAVKLFMNSAHRAQPSFELKTDNLDYVARICRLVHGMPLGIVLAAAWLAMLSPQEIANEIAQGIDFLADEGGDVPERQRSIRAVFDYSWQQMTEIEQQVFMKLSVFRGGFTREAAQAVASANLHILMSLMNKSLLRRDADSGRYEIHELLRQYAAEKLAELGYDKVTQDAHADYFAGFMAEREVGIKGQRQLQALDEIDADFENVSMAWKWELAKHNYININRMVDSLYLFSFLRAKGLVVLDLFHAAYNRLSSITDKPDNVWGRILARYGHLQGFYAQANEAVLEQIEQQLQMAKISGDQQAMAYFLSILGDIAQSTTDVEASAGYLEEAIAHYRQLGDKYYLAESLSRLGYTRFAMGHLAEGAELNQQSLVLQREIGDKVGMTWSLNNLAATLFIDGNYNDAEKYFEEVVALRNELGDTHSIGVAACHLSLLTFLHGDFDNARIQAEELLVLFTETNFTFNKGFISIVLGLLANIDNQYSEGHKLSAQGHSLASNPILIAYADLGLAIASVGLDDYSMARQHIWASLTYLSSTHMSGIMTWCLPVGAFIHEHDGQLESAVGLLSLAFTHPASATGWIEKWPLLTRLRDQLKAELGEEAYHVAWERGKSLDLETVVKQLLDEFDEEVL